MPSLTLWPAGDVWSFSFYLVFPFLGMSPSGLIRMLEILWSSAIQPFCSSSSMYWDNMSGWWTTDWWLDRADCKRTRVLLKPILCPCWSPCIMNAANSLSGWDTKGICHVDGDIIWACSDGSCSHLNCHGHVTSSDEKYRSIWPCRSTQRSIWDRIFLWPQLYTL